MQERATSEPPFRWNKAKERAAVLLAEDELNDKEIGAAVGVNDATIWRWKQHPAFADRVTGHLEELQAAMMRYRVAKKRERMKVLNALHDKFLTVIEERGAAMDGEYAGTGTGVVVRQVKQIGAGDRAVTVTEYVTDTGISKEIRDIHKQAAQETGQWVERGELSGPGGEPLVIRSISVPLPARDDGDDA